MFVSVFLVVPYFIFQLWSFVAPGLYEHEKKILWWVMCLSSLLFYLGVGFAYYIVFPLMFKFLMSFLPSGVTAMPDIREYLDFCMRLFLAFGIAFQVPVAVMILMYTGIADIATLEKNRPYVIVAAFIIAMIIAPPDVLSQILLALPMCLLYEVGVFLGKKLIVTSHRIHSN
jgi:sec-independent protein translocase protein TatC